MDEKAEEKKRQMRDDVNGGFEDDDNLGEGGAGQEIIDEEEL